MAAKRKRSILHPSWQDYLMLGTVVLATGALFVTLCLLSRDEELAVLRVDDRSVVTIYAEGEFFYEPPGYIYCEITRDGRVVVPRRRFMGIGPERVPSGRFSTTLADDGVLLAITLDGDVRLLYDFANRLSWPGPYTNTDERNYAFAKVALADLAVNGIEPPCSGLRHYERQRERREERQRAAEGTP